MELLSYHPNAEHSAYLLELIKGRDIEAIAVDFHSIYEMHNALLSSNSVVRDNAKILLDIVKYCRENDILLKFYGLRNEQKIKLLARKESKDNKMHRFFERLIKKSLSYDRSVSFPSWARKSYRSQLCSTLLYKNDIILLRNPFGLAHGVIANKILEIHEPSMLVLVPFEHFSAVKKRLKNKLKF